MDLQRVTGIFDSLFWGANAGTPITLRIKMKNRSNFVTRYGNGARHASIPFGHCLCASLEEGHPLVGFRYNGHVFARLSETECLLPVVYNGKEDPDTTDRSVGFFCSCTFSSKNNQYDEKSGQYAAQPV